MVWIVVVLVLLLGALAVAARARARRARAVQAAVELRVLRRVTDEDVTTFGEELTELHFDTLTTELDTPMRQDYQRALDSYESAKLLLHDAAEPADISGVTRSVEDGRYALSCVLARQSGDDLPQRRPPCFFNPAHGPADTDIEWAPGDGVPREIPVCSADAERLTHGAEPDTRLVRSGNRMVPWYDGGPTYGAYADGYYGSYALNGMFPAIVLGSMMSNAALFGMAAPIHGPAGYEGGASDGGGFGGGFDGGAGGGGDLGGFGGGF